LLKAGVSVGGKLIDFYMVMLGQVLAFQSEVARYHSNNILVQTRYLSWDFPAIL
jgi:hypothetical protein